MGQQKYPKPAGFCIRPYRKGTKKRSDVAAIALLDCLAECDNTVPGGVGFEVREVARLDVEH